MKDALAMTQASGRAKRGNAKTVCTGARIRKAKGGFVIEKEYERESTDGSYPGYAPNETHTVKNKEELKAWIDKHF